MTTTTAVPSLEPSRLATSTVAGLLAAATFETVAIAGITISAPRLVWLLAPLHVVVIAALAVHVRRLHLRARDTTLAMLGVLGVAAAGPLGALGTLALGQLSGRGSGDGRLLQAWYDRIALSVAVDPVTRFCDDVGSGRTVNLDAATPLSFAAVVADGSLAERQNVLGLIARRFHPDYLPVLASALRSSEPVIRVQAAAVAAHVRPAIARLFRMSVAAIPDAATEAPAALRLLRTFESMNESGLLDEGDRRQGVDIIERLGDIVLSLISNGQVPVPRDAALEDRVALEDTLERLYLRRHRYAELRVARSARRVLAGRKTARIRRVTSQGGRSRSVA